MRTPLRSLRPLPLLLAGVPALAAPAAAPRALAQDDAARARYHALLERTRDAAAIDVTGSIERTVEERPAAGAEPTTRAFLIEGEAHCARPISGWIRTTTVDRADESAVPLEAEYVADGASFFSVDRAARTAQRLGDAWLVVFPEVAPMRAWVGTAPDEPTTVTIVADPEGKGRTGLRMTWASALGGEPRAEELLWLDAADVPVAAETTTRAAGRVVRSRYLFRQWQIAEQADPAAYARKVPEGFTVGDVLGSLEESLLPIGSPAPEVDLVGLDGKRTPLASHRGKAVLLVFWSVRSATSNADLKRIQALWKELSAARDDVVFLGVDVGDPVAIVRAHWKEAGFGFPTAREDAGEVSSAFGVRGCPTVYVIGKQGRVLWGSYRYAEKPVRAILAATR